MDFITNQDIQNARFYCKKFATRKNTQQIFYELCFCICAPQGKIASNLKVNKLLQDADFFNNDLSIERIEEIVRPIRFYKNKAKYLFNAKNNFFEVLTILESNDDDVEKRVKLSKLVNGFGYKTASQFLRNSIGSSDLAIIDRHVLKFLKADKVQSKAHYEMLENQFRNIANHHELSVLELDSIIFVKNAKIDWHQIR